MKNSKKTKKVVILGLVSAILIQIVIGMGSSVAAVSVHPFEIKERPTIDLKIASGYWTNQGLRIDIQNNGNSDFKGRFIVGIIDMNNSSHQLGTYNFQGRIQAHGGIASRIISKFYGSDSNYPNLLIIVDQDNRVKETKEYNNTLLYYYYKNIIDIGVIDIDYYPNQLRVGEQMQLAGIFKNYSNVGLTYEAKLKIDGMTVKCSSKYVGANKNSAFVLDYIFNNPGQHYIEFILDPDNKLAETNENNNKVSKMVMVRSEEINLDLEAVNISYYPTPIQVGERVLLAGEFRNNSNIGLRYEAEFRVDGDVLTNTEYPKNYHANPDSKEYYYVFHTFDTPGMHKVEFILDPDNKLIESDKTNNRVSRIFWVERPQDNIFDSDNGSSGAGASYVIGMN